MAQITADDFIKSIRQTKNEPVDLGQSATTIGVDGELIPKGNNQLTADQFIESINQDRRANFKPFDWKASQKEGMAQAAKEEGKTQPWESSLLGVTNLGATAAQAFYKASDLLDTGINKITGTNYLPTNRYEQFTKQRKDEEDFHQLRREQNNQGFDWWKLAGELANPLAAYGKGYQGAKILSMEGAKITGQNALLGMGIGGTNFAEDSGDRLFNSVAGGIGGGLGSIAGEKVGQGARKIINSKPVRSAYSKLFNGVSDKMIQSVDKNIDDSLRKVGKSINDLPQNDLDSLRETLIKSLSNGKSKSVSSAADDAVVDNFINSAFKNSRDDYIKSLSANDLSETALKSIRNEIKTVLKQGKTVDKKAVERMAIFDDLKASGLDLKPTQKQATGEPNLWRKETELSKLEGGQALNNRYISQNDALLNHFDNLLDKTGGMSVSKHQTGENIISALSQGNSLKQQSIKELYNVAKNHLGNDLALDVNTIVQNSKQAMIDNFINPDKAQNALLAKLKPFLDPANPKPFTLKDKELFVKQINSAMGKTSDGETRAALGIVRSVLEEEVDNSLSTFGNSLRGDARNAWNTARTAAMQRFQSIDQTPALKAAIDDIAPDNFFDNFVLSKTTSARDVKSLLNELENNPESIKDLKLEIMRFISQNAVANQSKSISPAGIDRALKAIGDEKLKLFFNNEELKHLKNLKAVSMYLYSQPMGSNVNNSNSGSAFANIMKYMGLLDKVPFIGPKINSIQTNVVDGVKAQMNIRNGENAISRSAVEDKRIRDTELIRRLTKAGIISGSNLPNQ